MTAPVRSTWAALAAVGLAAGGMALIIFVVGWVLDPIPDPAREYVPPRCRPAGAMVPMSAGLDRYSVLALAIGVATMLVAAGGWWLAGRIVERAVAWLRSPDEHGHHPRPGAPKPPPPPPPPPSPPPSIAAMAVAGPYEHRGAYQRYRSSWATRALSNADAGHSATDRQVS